MPRLICIGMLCCIGPAILFAGSQAQASTYLVGDQNPWGIHWKEIETAHFRVIFPDEITADAQRVASTLEHVYPPDTKTLHVRSPRVPVILFTQRADINGWLTFLPRRCEWLNTPSAQGTSDWYSELAVHEFRHVAQFDSQRRGFNRLTYYLLGETGVMMMAGFSIPNWLFEGDATYAETALSESGRGRTPAFDAALRAQLLSGQRFPYYTAVFGSYGHHVPLTSPYLLGYYLTTHVRRECDADVWSRVVSRTARFSFIPYWFSRSLKKETRKSATETYKATLDELTALWRKQIDGLEFTEAAPLHAIDTRNWTSYGSPQFASDGSVIALRLGIDDVPQFVRINRVTGEETRLFMPGALTGGFSVAGTEIAWSEFGYDPRWGQRSYSVVKSYDLATGGRTTLTDKSRYYLPSFSPDMTSIAVVEYSPRNQCGIVTIDAKTGREVARLAMPPDESVFDPRWFPDGTRLVACFLRGNEGKGLATIDVTSGAVSEILPPAPADIMSPVTDGENVYFVAPYSGVDNVYAINLATKQIYQVTSRKFGAYNPSLSHDGTTLLFNDVTADGCVAVSMDLVPDRWVPLEQVEDRNLDYIGPLVSQEAAGSILKDIPIEEHRVEDYTGIRDLITVHSWVPYPDPANREFGLTLSSANLLGTFGTSLSYIYNWNERTHWGELSASYGGWYPIVDLGLGYGERTSTHLDADDKTGYYSWRETSPSIGLRIPLNLTHSLYATHADIGAFARYTKISDQEFASRFDNSNGEFIPITYWIYLSRGYQGPRDINPIWGQAVRGTYSHTPFQGDYRGEIVSTSGTFYFPGILRHHSFSTELGLERQRAPDDHREYHFGSEMLFARGYSSVFHHDLYKAGANYGLPLFYPDWNLLHTVQLKRIRTNIFYDHVVGRGGNREEMYRSVGVELSSDVGLFTISDLPLQVGIRYSHLIDEGAHHIGLIINHGLGL